MSHSDSDLREFGRFRLDPRKRVLWFKDRPVNLPLKEVELLCVLTEQPGEVITKDEIMGRIWADSFVEESNLSRHIYLIRKTLKEYGELEDVIETVPRRGYRFTVDVRTPANSEIFIERHSLTRTLVEEIDTGRTPGRKIWIDGRTRWFLVAAPIAILLIAGSVWLLTPGPTDGGPFADRSPKTLAILPLRSLNKETDDDSFGSGITENLAARIGALQSIVVRPNSSISRLIEAHEDPIEIGRKTNADAVLVGSYQRSDGRLRVSVRLINVSDGLQIWGGNFEERESDIFQLQDVLSAKVAESLVSRLSPAEKQLLTKRYTENREAYQAYLLGRFFFDKRTDEHYESALAEFKKAIALDSSFALAYTGLADVYALRANTAEDAERDGLYEMARQTAQRALELDDTIAEAHTTLAWIKRTHDWDWEGSELQFRRALEINPNYVNARQWYGMLLITRGRHDEAAAQFEKAIELAPLSKIVAVNAFNAPYFRGDIASLPGLAEQITRLDDSEPTNARVRLHAYVRTADYAKAVEVGEAYRETNDKELSNHSIAAKLAIAYSKIGEDVKANQVIGIVRADVGEHSEAAFRLAQIYGEIGRKEEALALLERCIDARDDRMVWLKVEPHFDSLRKDLRFVALLKRMRLHED